MMRAREPRPDLERRARNALARARGGYVALNPARDVVLVRERYPAVVLDGDVAASVLIGLGFTDLLFEIAADRPAKGPLVPVVIAIDSAFTLAWTSPDGLPRAA